MPARKSASAPSAAAAAGQARQLLAGGEPRYALLRENEEVLQLITLFYKAWLRFNTLYSRYTAERLFVFKDIDDFIETHLRGIKDIAHKLFRTRTRSESDQILQICFDMYFGTMFHIFLKAKENLRLQENYNLESIVPTLTQRLNTLAKESVSSSVIELFQYLNEDYLQGKQELESEIGKAKFIFERLVLLFQDIVHIYANNPEIIRKLYFEEPLFQKVYPDGGLERFFSYVYPKNGALEAYIVLGFDFIRSGHEGEALKIFKRACKLAKRDATAQKQCLSLFETYKQKALSLYPEGSPQAQKIGKITASIEAQLCSELSASSGL
jgi:hypothetical protein